MWALVLTLGLGQSALAAPTTPATPENGIDLKMVSDVLAQLESMPVAEGDDNVSPEILDLYHDVDVLWAVQNSNLSESREGKGFLSKLSFLTGLKLGSILSGSGTLAASQSINILGKVLNAALSVSYGSLGGYPGVGTGYPGVGTGYPGGYYPPGGVGGVQPLVGIQQLPTIQENVPADDKKREKPDGLLGSSTESLLPASEDTPPAEAVRQEFIKSHNQRVELFNNIFGQKMVNARTGRIERPKFDQIT